MQLQTQKLMNWLKIYSESSYATKYIHSVLEVRFKNELVLVLVHFTKKRTFRSFLVLWEKVN